ncbi:MAG: hypothetical protein ACOY3P_08655, partial [Planctomycetota bacterium]
FTNGHEPGFDPVSVGIGQGLTQGTVGGMLVGLVIVALLCWREVRFHQADEPRSSIDRKPLKSSTAAGPVLLVAGVVLALGSCTCSGVMLGQLRGAAGAYHRRFLEEQRAIAPLLASDPAFAGVELREHSAGGVYLIGEVPTAADLGRLRAGLVQAVGEERTQAAIAGVSVNVEHAHGDSR